MNHKIVIIIGLPGSGKTTYANTLTNYLIFDDFIRDFYNGEIIKFIKMGKYVCLNDPRLCIMNVFNRYIKEILTFVSIKDIHLILFENNPDICLKNIDNRIDNRKGIKQSINQYSLYYDLNNYQKYSHTIKAVYSNFNINITTIISV